MTDYEVTPPPERLADRVQLCTAFSTEKGEVTRFVIQLEYWLDGDWHEVVRYDHDRDAPGGHDVTGEGLHRDVYRDGEKHRTEEVSPPVPANEAFDYLNQGESPAVHGGRESDHFHSACHIFMQSGVVSSVTQRGKLEVVWRSSRRRGR